MQTLVLKKPLKRSPNLEKLNLISKYNSYLRLVNSGFFRDQAMAMAELQDRSQFIKARNYYRDI